MHHRCHNLIENRIYSYTFWYHTCSNLLYWSYSHLNKYTSRFGSCSKDYYDHCTYTGFYCNFQMCRCTWSSRRNFKTIEPINMWCLSSRLFSRVGSSLLGYVILQLWQWVHLKFIMVFLLVWWMISYPPSLPSQLVATGILLSMLLRQLSILLNLWRNV